MRQLAVILSAVMLSIPTAAAEGTAVASGDTAHGFTARLGPYIEVLPDSGPGGIRIRIRGEANSNLCVSLAVSFMDSAGETTLLGSSTDFDFQLSSRIPLGAALGAGSVSAASQSHWDPRSHCVPGGGTFASTAFVVTPSPSAWRQHRSPHGRRLN